MPWSFLKVNKFPVNLYNIFTGGGGGGITTIFQKCASLFEFSLTLGKFLINWSMAVLYPWKGREKSCFLLCWEICFECELELH